MEYWTLALLAVPPSYSRPRHVHDLPFSRKSLHVRYTNPAIQVGALLLCYSHQERGYNRL